MGWWKELAEKFDSVSIEVHIAMVGKYTNSPDSYHSVVKALEHSAIAVNRKLVIDFIEAENLYLDKEDAWKLLKQADGVVVPGGFGERGLEGKIKAINYVRTNQKPFLGICLGMQCAVIEFARNCCDIPGANSEEFSKDPEDTVIFMPEGDKT